MLNSLYDCFLQVNSESQNPATDMTKNDLANYTVYVTKPISFDFKSKLPIVNHVMPSKDASVQLPNNL